MENKDNDFSIDKKTRGFLSKGRRIYSIAFGTFILIIGLIPFVRNGFSFQNDDSYFHVTIILMGLLQIIFGFIGRELNTIRYRLKMDSESLRIKKTFEHETIINLDSIKQVKTFQMRLEIFFDDYVKTYDFSWLTIEEFENLRARISDYCLKKKIEFK